MAKLNKHTAKKKYFSLSQAIKRAECEEDKNAFRKKRSFFYRIWKSKEQK